MTTTNQTRPAFPRIPFGAFRSRVAGLTVPADRTPLYVQRTTDRGGASYHPVHFLPDYLRAELIADPARYTDPRTGGELRYFTLRDGTRDTYDEIQPATVPGNTDPDGFILRAGVRPTDVRERSFPGLVKTRAGLIPFVPAARVAVAAAPVVPTPVVPATFDDFFTAVPEPTPAEPTTPETAPAAPETADPAPVEPEPVPTTKPARRPRGKK